MKKRRKDRQAQLHDAVMSAATKDHRAARTGKRSHNVRAVLAIGKVAWRLRRAEKKRR